MLELATQNAFGLIENIVLIGTPAPSDSEDWTKIRSVVSGRVINVYSTRDYILGLIYRASSIRIDVAGLQPIEDVNGVENFDASHLVESHDQYRLVVGQILKSVGFEDVDEMQVQAERSTLKTLKSQEQAQVKPVKDAETETAEVEAEIEEQTGGRITMVDIDEQEEQRKEDLIRSAEENEHGSTVPEAQIDDQMQRLHLSEFAPSTQQLDLSGPQTGVTNSQRREGDSKVAEERDVHDEKERFEDEELEGSTSLTFLQPEPEPDSEPEPI